MPTFVNQKPNRTHKIYLKNTDQWIPVTDEIYETYYRPVWRAQKAAKKAGQCNCQSEMLWKCDGDCFTCSFHKAGNTLSMDAPVEGTDDNENICLGDTLADRDSDFTGMLADKLLLEQLLDELAVQDPAGSRICKLIIDGLSEREAAVEMNMARSTFKRRWSSTKIRLIKLLEKHNVFSS